MIKIASLNAAPDKWLKRQELGRETQLQKEAPDIICCQGMYRSVDGTYDQARSLASLLNMNYSFSATGQKKKKKQGRHVDGLEGVAILGGANTWMLNSGSFTLCTESEEGESKQKDVAQFAVIRKGAASVLVVNMKIAGNGLLEEKQLHAIFARPLFKEQFSLLVLAVDMDQGLEGRLRAGFVPNLRFKLQNSTIKKDVGKPSGLYFFVSRETPLATVNFVSEAQLAKLPGCGHKNPTFPYVTSLELEPIPCKKRNSRSHPLSFKERWRGYRDSRDLLFSF